ncbi:MAG: protein kinase [Planctomycetota bacterium]|nr:protein kinase [Planctomycetota bacterium]
MAEQIVGITLAGCKIIKLLGKGGMGAVYLGRQVDLGRFVALKILSKNLIQEEGFLRRFKREARSVAALSHPNIVSVFQYGEEDGLHFIVMEYVEGDTLGQMIVKSKTLEEGEAIRIFRDTAIGIREAQKKNIVHRDIKPDNIILNKNGDVKVADFGLAKNLSGNQSESLVTKQIIGTPAYISPEQIKGTEIDPRSDIYSLGATIYHCLVGRPPFTAKNPFELLEKHLKEKPVPPKELRPELSDEISEIVVKCLQKDAKKRYQSCEQLIADLERLQTGAKGLGGGGMKSWSRGWPVRLSVAAVAIAALAWVGVKLSAGGEAPANGDVMVRGNGNPTGNNGGNNGGDNGGNNGSNHIPVVTELELKKEKFKSLMEQGEAYEKKERPEFALEMFEKALELFPDTTGLQSRVDSIRKALEEELAAKAAEEELKDLRLGAVEAFSDLRGGGQRDPEKLDATIELLERLKQKVPDDVVVRRRLAVVRGWREALGESGPLNPNNGENGELPGLNLPTFDDPAESDTLPPTPFLAELELTRERHFSGMILELTEEYGWIKANVGKMGFRMDEVVKLKPKGSGFRVLQGEEISEIMRARSQEPLKFRVTPMSVKDKPGFIRLEYSFRKPIQLEDWDLHKGRFDPLGKGIILGPGGRLTFKTNFIGDVDIEVWVRPAKEGVFQTFIYRRNVGVSTLWTESPSLSDDWEHETLEWNDTKKNSPYLTEGGNTLKIKRERGTVYVSVNYAPDLPLDGVIKSGLGKIAFGGRGGKFTVENVILIGKPRR